MTAAPTGPSQSPTSRQALADAYQNALRADAERRAAEAAERARGPRRPWAAIVSLVVLALVGAWLAIDRPSWLFPDRPPATALSQEAGLRLTMYAAATRIEEFRERQLEYPANLAQVAGVSGRDLRYERTGTSGWVLRGRRGELALTLRSGEPLEPFLGTSLSDYLGRGGR